MASAWILDVGHGNSTVVEDCGRVSVIDGGRGDTLLRFLDDKGFRGIDTVIVSHADADHIGGLSLLLADRDFHVDHVYVNPDSRQSRVWIDFVTVLTDAKSRDTAVHLELTEANPGELLVGRTKLEVLAPTQENALMTESGSTVDGVSLTPNSMSAVIRVWAQHAPRILVPGDIDQNGLNELVNKSSDIRADVLVFPHHGGKPGASDPVAFAKELINCVVPKLVVFSVSRGQRDTPRPEIVSAVLNASESLHIACTQLSKRCAMDLPDHHEATADRIALGASTNACCAGTIFVSLAPELDYSPNRARHNSFVRNHAPSAMCRVTPVSTD